LAYVFDLAGNLSTRARTAGGTTTTETLVNDALNRLTQSTITTGGTNTVVFTAGYDKLGNLCTKNGTAYTYGGPAGCIGHGSVGSPDQVTKVGTVTYTYDGDGNQASGGGRTIAYNAMNQVAQATLSTNQTAFQYDPDGGRFQRIDNTTTTTTYVGNVEILRTGSSTETRRYLAGVAIDFVRSSGSNQTLYQFADHLGSTDILAGSTGTLTEALSFDVHGNYRNATTWQGSAPETGVGSAYTRHGFTGHEQADPVGLIHMNGRIYDPQIGRMLQADPVADGTPQGWNRYSYVANNPLSLTDPTGYMSWGAILRDVAAIVITYYTGGVLGPALWAEESYAGAIAVVGAGGFAAGALQSGTLKGGVYGAFSAELFFGVGEGFDSAGWAQANGDGVLGKHLSSAGYTATILAHGLAGGLMQSLVGGKFGSGFVGAGVSFALTPSVNRLNSYGDRVIASAIIGGTASQIAGGKFANGAVTAAFSYTYSQVASRAAQNDDVSGSRVGGSGAGNGPVANVLSTAYGSEDDALAAASSLIAGYPNSGKWEYGGAILTAGGSYYITDPVTIQSDQHFAFNGISGAPDGAQLYAIYHNHPDLGPAPSWFSPDDVNRATSLGVSSFKFTPSGTRLFFATHYDGVTLRFQPETLVLPQGVVKGASSGISY
jgi:RHS repeat-associated protein